jgi:ribosomal protein L13E
MKVRNKFIIGVATLLSVGVLLASPVKAGVDEDKAAEIGISVAEYRRLLEITLRYEAKQNTVNFIMKQPNGV